MTNNTFKRLHFISRAISYSHSCRKHVTEKAIFFFIIFFNFPCTGFHTSDLGACSQTSYPIRERCLCLQCIVLDNIPKQIPIRLYGFHQQKIEKNIHIYSQLSSLPARIDLFQQWGVGGGAVGRAFTVSPAAPSVGSTTLVFLDGGCQRERGTE